MKFFTAAYSDIGIKKSINQDALSIQVADTDNGRAVLGVICDGMGGLAKGEVASAALITAFSKWFMEEFPQMIHEEVTENNLQGSWNKLIQVQNKKIMNYGDELHVRVGTTVSAILIYRDQYYIVNVGDSRVYEIREGITQITKDHTFVQREMDMGRMTLEAAAVSDKRNVLVQCVGASYIVTPDFFIGPVDRGTTYLLCTDGFRHTISGKEIYEKCNPWAVQNEQQMESNLRYLTDLNKYRQETDNISSMLIGLYD